MKIPLWLFIVSLGGVYFLVRAKSQQTAANAQGTAALNAAGVPASQQNVDLYNSMMNAK